MYRVFLCGLLYKYVPDVWKVLCVSYMLSSITYIFNPTSPVHHMLIYPVACLVGVFASDAVRGVPSKYPLLHALCVVPWVCGSAYGVWGYPMFIVPYVLSLLICGMHNWALFSGVTMLFSVSQPPLITLSMPVWMLLFSRCINCPLDE